MVVVGGGKCKLILKLRMDLFFEDEEEDFLGSEESEIANTHKRK